MKRGRPWSGDPNPRSRKRSAIPTRGVTKNRRRMALGSSTYYQTVPRTRGPYASGETKYFDATITSTPIVADADWANTELDPVSSVDCLFAPAQGTAINQRIGNKVWVSKIRIRGVVSAAAQANQTAADLPPMIRIICYKDMQTNGTQAQGETIMTGQATGSQAVCAFQNIANFGRFRVLKDKTYHLTPPTMSYDGTNVEQSGEVLHFKWTLPVNCMVKFNATTTSTIAAIVDNSFHVIANCQNTGMAPALSYVARTYYKDY